MQDEQASASADAASTEEPLPDLETRARQALQIAMDLFDTQADWVSFFRQILGAKGVVWQMFQSQADREAFERTVEYAEIQHMVARLRKRGDTNLEVDEPFKVITVRLPKSMREALQEEAKALGTTMNQLCISKLLQLVDGEVVPGGRKPPTLRPKRPAEEAPQQANESPGGSTPSDDNDLANAVDESVVQPRDEEDQSEI